MVSKLKLLLFLPIFHDAMWLDCCELDSIEECVVIQTWWEIETQLGSVIGLEGRFIPF